MARFVLDVWPLPDGMEVWTVEDGRASCETIPWRPTVYARPLRTGIAEAAAALRALPEVGSAEPGEGRIWPEDRPAAVVALRPRAACAALALARAVDAFGGYAGYDLYNVEPRPEMRFLSERGLFPLAWMEGGRLAPWEDRFALDYPPPPLRSVFLDAGRGGGPGAPRGAEDGAWWAAVGDERITAEDPGDLVRAVSALVRRKDPDVVVTRGGDARTLPALARMAAAAGAPLDLGRAPAPLPQRAGGRSLYSYGRAVYRPHPVRLRGRVHVDQRSSFLLSDGGLEGLVDLSRVTGVPLHDAARDGPGTLISTMELLTAQREGWLVPWKKNAPERPKTVRALLLADRGGLIYEPRVGLHTGVAELDFASLYPTLMVNHNISAETVGCACCAETGEPVPGLGYHLCARRRGIIPRVIGPLLERRRVFKERSRGPGGDRYEGMQAAIKWLLVTSFGYMGYRNAPFGRIEAYESITAFSRETLLRAAHAVEAAGYEVLHGLVDSLWVRRARPDAEDLAETASRIGGDLGVPLKLEGAYRWVVFLPVRAEGGAGGPGTAVGALTRYYGVREDGTIKVRGLEMRREDWPPALSRAQEAMVRALAPAADEAGYLARVPAAVRALREAVPGVMAAPLEDLAFSRRVSRPMDAFGVRTPVAAAMRLLLAEEGWAPEPGERMVYVLVDPRSAPPRLRARLGRRRPGSTAVPLAMAEGCEPDRAAYLALVARMGASVLAHLGIGEVEVLAALSGGRQGRLDDDAAWAGVPGRRPRPY